MSIFTQHTDQTAPSGSAEVLSKIEDRYGFVPNLAAYVAEAPGVLQAMLNIAESFDASSFSPQEQQLIMLTTSALNGCEYCKAVHTGLGHMAKIDTATLQAIIAFEALPDPMLNALRKFTHQVVEQKGWVDEAEVQKFLDAGYNRAQVFEVIMGVAMKTMTNYCNHLTGAEPNEEFIAMAEDKVTA